MKTIEIIEYFNPRVWFIENPQTGLLKKKEFMVGKPFKDVDYCKYGMPYRKRTSLWNNLDKWTPQPLCKKNSTAWMETVTKKQHREHHQERK